MQNTLSDASPPNTPTAEPAANAGPHLRPARVAAAMRRGGQDELQHEDHGAVIVQQHSGGAELRKHPPVTILLK